MTGRSRTPTGTGRDTTGGRVYKRNADYGPARTDIGAIAVNRYAFWHDSELYVVQSLRSFAERANRDLGWWTVEGEQPVVLREAGNEILALVLGVKARRRFFVAWERAATNAAKKGKRPALAIVRSDYLPPHEEAMGRVCVITRMDSACRLTR